MFAEVVQTTFTLATVFVRATDWGLSTLVMLNDARFSIAVLLPWQTEAALVLQSQVRGLPWKRFDWS